MKMAVQFDLLILGSGSTAFAAALAAQELGKTVVMTEERIIGGTCVNRGCLPSKNLIEAARIIHEARNPRYPGIEPAQIKFNFRELIRQKDDVVHSYRKKKYDSLVGDLISIERGHVQFVDAHTVEVDGKQLSGKNILIATGSRPSLPEIDGLENIDYLTSDLLSADESSELTDPPESLLIVGGGYIALELGQMFQRFGSRVTLFERSKQLLLHGYEPELGAAIADVMASEGMDIVIGAQVQSVRKSGDQIIAVVNVGEKPVEYQAHRLLIATGRIPNSDKIAIERTDVMTNGRGEIIVDEFLRTNVDHIFAAGDVIGREVASQMATPVGSQDGGIAAHNALSGESLRKINHRVIPRAIFIDPQVASVGVTEEQAIAMGHKCWCNTVDMELVPRAGAVRDTRGLIKMVADEDTNQVLGLTMFGLNAAEVIHEAAMALRFNAKVEDFIEMLHVYPTTAEALKIVAISRFKNPAKLSCCAE